MAPEEMSPRQVVVIGTGPAGLAAALALRDAGLDPLVIDRAEQVVSSWRSRYHRLRLNGMAPVGWSRPRPAPSMRSSSSSRPDTRIDPVIPAWNGRDGCAGELVHSSQYRNPQPFQGKKVLVVGPGCSGMEIAYDLAEGGAAKVWLSARTPPNILLRQGAGGLPGDVLGVALLRFPARWGDAVAGVGRRREVGKLTAYGLPVPEEGPMSRLHRLGVAPAIIDRGGHRGDQGGADRGRAGRRVTRLGQREARRRRAGRARGGHLR